ncbi:MAG: triose-phosphate isomerase [Ignavibacteriae bacterium]|nr:triose-phosphate isomerase [Ignavibacteriota bacterium]
MRRTVIAGNWKMFKTVDESVELVTALKPLTSNLKPNVDVIVCPPFTSLAIVANLLKGSNVKLGAQNMSEQDEGAYTGEVSWKMLKSAGCEYVILGHSERRQYFGETNELINLKAKKALANGLRPIICVGEKLDEREKGVTEQIISTQIKGVLGGISSDDLKKVIIAYEPVWAIGTGKTASPLQAEEVHQHIRKLVAQLYSWNVAEGLVIQYGGSVKPDNAAELLAQDDIDGALVGGACLKADSFASIISASPSR